MIKGRKVYDPLTDTWSTGYWVVDDKGNYYPMWQKGTVMERLTDKIDNTNCVKGCGSNCKYGFQYCCKEDWENCQTISDVIDKLAYYEDLEEQGRLLKLPCRVGDTVYGISMGKIITLIVNEISIFYMKGEKIINVKCQNDDMFRNYIETEFGKTVFLTKAEAEAKLKELRGEENDNS